MTVLLLNNSANARIGLDVGFFFVVALPVWKSLNSEHESEVSFKYNIDMQLYN